jgi:hypothetical protein
MRVISGNRVAGTESGIYYSNLASPGWLETDIIVSSRLSGNIDVESDFMKLFIE